MIKLEYKAVIWINVNSAVKKSFFPSDATIAKVASVCNTGYPKATVAPTSLNEGRLAAAKPEKKLI